MDGLCGFNTYCLHKCADITSTDGNTCNSLQINERLAKALRQQVWTRCEAEEERCGKAAGFSEQSHDTKFYEF